MILNLHWIKITCIILKGSWKLVFHQYEVEVNVVSLWPDVSSLGNRAS